MMDTDLPSEARVADQRARCDQRAPARRRRRGADHRAGIVPGRSVLLPDRGHLRADDAVCGDAAGRRPSSVADRPAAGRRRAHRLGVHLPHRRRHQLLLDALRAADRGGEHGPVQARRPAGGHAQRACSTAAWCSWQYLAVAGLLFDSVAGPAPCRSSAARRGAVHRGAEHVRLLRRGAPQRVAGRQRAVGRGAGSSGRRPRSPICRR